MHALAFLILAWNPDETGTSTEWSSLPTPVEQSFTLASVHDLSVLVIADFSSVQSDSSAAFRILVDDSVRATINTSTAYSRDDGALSFHGVCRFPSPGAHTAALQYKIDSGSVQITDARLTLIEVTSDKLATRAWGGDEWPSGGMELAAGRQPALACILV